MQVTFKPADPLLDQFDFLKSGESEVVGTPERSVFAHLQEKGAHSSLDRGVDTSTVAVEAVNKSPQQEFRLNRV